MSSLFREKFKEGIEARDALFLIIFLFVFVWVLDSFKTILDEVLDAIQICFF